jgi:FeS assembly SUF system protein
MGLRTRLKSTAKKVAKRVLNRVDREEPTENVSTGPSSQDIEPIASSPPGMYPTVDEAETNALAEELEATEEEDTPSIITAEMMEEPVEDNIPNELDAQDEEESTPLPPKLEGPEVDALCAEIVAAIETIFDPEIPVNIYELGLIYDIDVHEGNAIQIAMTLTSPNCPAAQSLPAEVKVKTEGIEGVQSANVEIVWDPIWGPHLMTEEARLELNL